TPTTSVLAGSAGNTVVFTDTAATGGLTNGAVTVAVPTGWSAPSTTGANAGFTTASGGTGTDTVSVAAQTITVSGVSLAAAATLTITSGSKPSAGPRATASSPLGAQSWQAQEESTSGGTLTNLAASPSITVTNAPNGSGTLTTPTASVVAGSAGNTVVFTYTAATGGMTNGAVTVAVPTGPSARAATGGNAGITPASTSPVAV